MRPLRLVFVICRLWPLVGGSEKVMAHLAVGLIGRGHRVTILTAEWQPQWPRRIRLHQLPVVRLPHAPKGGWVTFRYLRALGGWLRRNRADFDLVYVSASATRPMRRSGRSGATCRSSCGPSGQDARAIAFGRSTPHAAGRSRPGAWRRRHWWPRVVRSDEMLEAAGYPRARIHELPDGVPILSPRSAETRLRRGRCSARRSRQRSHCGGPLALYVGPLRADRGLRQPATAWESIVARWGDARLWLAGDGPDRKALGEQIDAMNLRHRLLLVGVFDTVDELFSAADLFVMPTLEGGGALALREAMGAGLPIVAGDTPGNRAALADGPQAPARAGGRSGEPRHRHRPADRTARPGGPTGRRRATPCRGRVLPCQDDRRPRNIVRAPGCHKPRYGRTGGNAGFAISALLLQRTGVRNFPFMRQVRPRRGP